MHLPKFRLVVATAAGVAVALAGRPAAAGQSPEEARESGAARRSEKPVDLTCYDIATRGDLFAARMRAPLVKWDEPDEWSVLEGLEDQLGGWIMDYLTANRIANTINTALPVGGQPALRRIDWIVPEIREELGKPSVSAPTGTKMSAVRRREAVAALH